MKILVTGGAGYIGSHTAALLRERGDFVVALDSMEFGHQQALGDIPLVVGRVHDQELVKKIIAEYDIEAIVHFAAYKAAGESMLNPAKYFENNFVGSVRLMEAANEAGVKKFVFSSTAAVYGTPEKLPVSEEAELNPENPYGESKLLVERALRWFNDCYGFRYVALRYFNAAGAALDGENGEDPRQVSNLIPIVMNVASGRAKKLKVFGDDYPTPDGTCVRDYIHVLDLASAHAKALDYLSTPLCKSPPGRGDEVYPSHVMGEGRKGQPSPAHSGTLPHTWGRANNIFNLGTGRGTSVAEVIKLAREITGKEIPAEVVARRPGDPASVWADNAKAIKELGWQPRYGIKEIIGSAWEWSVKHPNGFEG
jgi:UDP-glucose 4-epimerase